MPPKKVAGRPGVNARSQPAAGRGRTPAKQPASTKKNVPATNKKGGTTTKTAQTPKKEVKKEPTKEELAAVAIQKNIRRYLAIKELQKLKQKQIEYDEMIEKLQKEAFVAMVKAEQEAAEREFQREEEERKRKRLEAQRKKRMLEAAFDGDIDEMLCVLKEVDDLDTANGVSNDDVGRVIRRSHQMAVVDCEDANENTPLSEAGGGGSAEAITFLVERGYQTAHGPLKGPCAQSAIFPQPPQPLVGGNFHKMRKLLDFSLNCGANPNTVGAWGRTPLYRAAFGGHLEAVSALLQYGADPRIRAEDSNTPAEAGSVQAIVETLNNWDISFTESMLEKMEAEKERRTQEDQMRKEAETNKLQSELDALKEDYDKMQKVLKRAYEELEKRISEHDQCVLEQSNMVDVTLQSVHDAEAEVEFAKLHAEQARSKLEQARLMLREKEHEGEETLPGINCNIRELDEVLMRDVGNRIKDSGKWPLLIDPTGQATTFLRYRDTNYACALNPNHMQAEVIRMGLLGAIRFGKPYVLDMLDVDMVESCENIFDLIQPDLYQDIMSRELLKDERYMKLVRSTDDDQYQPSKFQHHRVDRFLFVIVTKNKYPSDDLMEKMYPLRIVLPSK